jgi:hypothetical protein
MFATIPAWLQTIADTTPLLAGIGTMLAWIARRWRRWMTDHVSGPIEGIRNDVNNLGDYTRYHLGPNGSSPALHQQVKQIDCRLDVLENRPRQRRKPKDEQAD